MPILISTACDEEFQIIRGFDAGAYDYIILIIGIMLAMFFSSGQCSLFLVLNLRMTNTNAEQLMTSMAYKQ